MSLFWRLFLGSVATLLVATLVLAFAPVTVSETASLDEILVLGMGLTAIFAVNGFIIRRALRPLGDLREALTALDAPRRDRGVLVRGHDEIAALATAYNLMLARLERERESSTRASLTAQEGERARVAAELHDEVGQRLTVMLLRLELLGRELTAPLRGEVSELSELARRTHDDVRAISARLRPGVLADLGLKAALADLVDELSRHSGLVVESVFPAGLEGSPEEELVIYRVVQEALTNVVRHAGARRAVVMIAESNTGLEVVIRDDGSGARGQAGTGIMGMSERARLVHGTLVVDAMPGVGTTVRLSIPTWRSGGHE
jgi:two-component system sensor histidine kinase UhpB